MKPVRYSLLSPLERRDIREQYIKKQKGMCWFCGEPLDSMPPHYLQDIPIDMSLFPTNFLKYPVHLQHNHDTDMTEGAVHAYCNAIMWQYEGR